MHAVIAVGLGIEEARRAAELFPAEALEVEVDAVDRVLDAVRDAKLQRSGGKIELIDALLPRTVNAPLAVAVHRAVTVDGAGGQAVAVAQRRSAVIRADKGEGIKGFFKCKALGERRGGVILVAVENLDAVGVEEHRGVLAQLAEADLIIDHGVEHIRALGRPAVVAGGGGGIGEEVLLKVFLRRDIGLVRDRKDKGAIIVTFFIIRGLDRDRVNSTALDVIDIRRRVGGISIRVDDHGIAVVTEDDVLRRVSGGSRTGDPRDQVGGRKILRHACTLCQDGILAGEKGVGRTADNRADLLLIFFSAAESEGEFKVIAVLFNAFVVEPCTVDCGTRSIVDELVLDGVDINRQRIFYRNGAAAVESVAPDTRLGYYADGRLIASREREGSRQYQ